MKRNRFFFSALAVGIMLLNNTATAHADWSPNSTSVNSYSGEITLSSLDQHNLDDFRRVDPAATGGDALFGSTSVQAPVTLVAGAMIEIEIMQAGVTVDNRKVNGRKCPANKNFNAFVTPVATCSAYFGDNFTGFRAQAEQLTAVNADGEKHWKPMLYMNTRGKWVDLGAGGNTTNYTPSTNSGLSGGSATTKELCAQVLVQKVCQ